MSSATRTTIYTTMSKNAQIIFNLRKIFNDINEKWFIRFSIITGNGKDKDGARIVKYDDANGVLLSKHGDGFKLVEDSVLRLLTTTNPDEYEIKIEKSAVLYRWPNSKGMTNWRKLTFSVIR